LEKKRGYTSTQKDFPGGAREIFSRIKKAPSSDWVQLSFRVTLQVGSLQPAAPLAKILPRSISAKF
jgi:hypothetical protein